LGLQAWHQGHCDSGHNFGFVRFFSFFPCARRQLKFFLKDADMQEQDLFFKKKIQKELFYIVLKLDLLTFSIVSKVFRPQSAR